MLLPRPFPATFQAAIELVKAHDAALAGLPSASEMLICLSGDGHTVIDAAVGAVDKVTLTPKMLAAAASSEGCRFVHNHPSGGSISAADWRLALGQLGILEILAVNRRGSIFQAAVSRASTIDLQQVVAASDLSADVDDDLFRSAWATYDVAVKTDPNVQSPQPLQDAIRWMWSHFVNERLHAKGHAEYHAILSGPDQTDLHDSRLVRIIADGKALIASHIP